jgi:hypothetical protein
MAASGRAAGQFYKADFRYVLSKDEYHTRPRPEGAGRERRVSGISVGLGNLTEDFL